MIVSVIGGGKMGLPLACQIADKGAEVHICDINSELVEKINQAEAPFEEPQLEDYLKRNVSNGRLSATTDTSKAVAKSNVVIVIVPAVLTKNDEIDFANLKAASQAIVKGLKKGSLISYETTLPVGDCRRVLTPVLEESGLSSGEDFYVSFSPERVKSLKVFDRLQKTPKVVGGINTISAKKAEEFYHKYLGAEIINVETLEAAEFVKLAGMLYRDVNIALVNELAGLSEQLGVDFNQVLQAANTNGEAFLLTPGIGVGGHCTPVYPHFLINLAKKINYPLILATEARKINKNTPKRYIQRLAKEMGSLSNKKIHILGLAFRPSVKEHICSPAFDLKSELEMQGAIVSMEDPYYTSEELKVHGFQYASIQNNSFDAIILNTAHPQFSEVNFNDCSQKGLQFALDGRNFWNAQKVTQSGVKYLSIGQATI